jgi:hypothetical protein
VEAGFLKYRKYLLNPILLPPLGLIFSRRSAPKKILPSSSPYPFHTRVFFFLPAPAASSPLLQPRPVRFPLSALRFPLPAEPPRHEASPCVRHFLSSPPSLLTDRAPSLSPRSRHRAPHSLLALPVHGRVSPSLPRGRRLSSGRVPISLGVGLCFAPTADSLPWRPARAPVRLLLYWLAPSVCRAPCSLRVPGSRSPLLAAPFAPPSRTQLDLISWLLYTAPLVATVNLEHRLEHPLPRALFARRVAPRLH